MTNQETTAMMNSDIKERWVKSLRSGNFVQTTNKLQSQGSDVRPDGYCCLGVLCELAIEDGVINKYKEKASYVDSYHFGNETDGYGQFLTPRAAWRWAQMEDSNPQFWIDKGDLPKSVDPDETVIAEGDQYLVSLTGLNDGGASFEEIATIIEKYF